LKYRNLGDREFVNLLYTSADRLDEEYLDETERRRETLIPLLCEVLKNEENYKWDEAGRWWSTVHAVHILGILGDARAMDALLTASVYADIHDLEWIWEALPECYARIGTAALPPIREAFLERMREGGTSLGAEMEGLWNLWEDHPGSRREIEDFFLSLLKSEETPFDVKADIIADFSQMHRTDLKSLFEELFEAGEVDLEVFTREDMEEFFRGAKSTPVYRMDLRGFYSAGETEARRAFLERDREEQEQRDLETFLRDNVHRIGRNDPCPCGSGIKFKHCHLDRAEENARTYREEQMRQEPARVLREAVYAERRSESEIRRVLARKGLTPLFSRLKEAVLEAVLDPREELVKKKFWSYFNPLLEEIPFDDEEELQDFNGLFLEYYDAIAALYLHYPKEKEHLDS
jgi:hypothetical protein